MLLRESARPAAVREHRLAPWFAVGTVCFGAFMGQLDASIVTLAFPALQHQFAMGLAGVQWVSLAYLLALVALLVPVGRWSDRAGRKLVYLGGFVLFTAASVGCGLAWSLGALIALRVLQAAGAAMLQANSVALVTTSAPVRHRRAALAVQASAQALGLALGPVAGGLLLSSLGWRWIFFVNVPVGVAAVASAWFLLPRTRHFADQARPDLPGFALLVTATAAALVAVSAVSGLGTPTWAAAVAAGLAVLAGAGLSWWEHRASSPLIDVPTMTAGGMAYLLAGALCAYMVLFGPLVLFPQLLSARGDSALRVGLIVTALPSGFGIAAIAAERLVPAGWPNRRRCFGGGILASASAAALAVTASPAVVILLLGLLGAGLGVYIPANNAAIMAAAPPHGAAMVGGMVNMTRGLGTALGVSAVSLALHVGATAAPAMLTLGAFGLAATAAGRHRAAGEHHREPPVGAEGKR